MQPARTLSASKSFLSRSAISDLRDRQARMLSGCNKRWIAKAGGLEHGSCWTWQGGLSCPTIIPRSRCFVVAKGAHHEAAKHVELRFCSRAAPGTVVGDLGPHGFVPLASRTAALG